MFNENDISSSGCTTGSTVLARSSFSILSGSRVGFVGNHTSRLNNGASTLACLIESRACSVARLFAPEHGAFGTYDELVDDESDPNSGLTIHSLYGEMKKPAKDMLDDLDFLILELQDVGVRFYTYTSTLLHCIDACSETNTQLIVLDRPNPINGIDCDGPGIDDSHCSFVAPYQIPVRTGLTLGELGKLYASETGRDDIYDVVPMSAWKRSYFYDETKLDWIPPSPAMKSLDTAIVYPGVCLIEQTNVSVGRGTDTPFQFIGAPYIDSHGLAAAINEHAMPGITSRPAVFAPHSSKFAGQVCNGIQLVVTDRNAFHPVWLGIALLTALWKLYPEDFDLESSKTLVANDEVISLIKSGTDIEATIRSWQSYNESWRNRRQSCLLY